MKNENYKSIHNDLLALIKRKVNRFWSLCLQTEIYRYYDTEKPYLTKLMAINTFLLFWFLISITLEFSIFFAKTHTFLKTPFCRIILKTLNKSNNLTKEETKN